MPSEDEEGINSMKVHPKYLESNSTSHTWAFGAFAELIDNSYDAKAKEIHIDQLVLAGVRCLSFQDDGLGMDQDRLYKMLSFGYCDKDSRNPVGMYGNGFKSGSMRLGKDVIVFTRTKESAGIGLLSQTYLTAIKAETVLVPMLHYSFPDLKYVENDQREKNLKAMLKHSPFRTEEELTQQLSVLQGTGTRIVIYNLRKMNKYDRIELDFTKNPTDIRCPDIVEKGHEDTPSYRNSLREYCSILFLHPKMKIKIRGSYVKTRLIDKSLKQSQIDEYKPKGDVKGYPITFGRVPESVTTGEYGIMFYRGNRLIKPYEMVTCQKQNDGTGVGVVGVTDVSFLTPIHNKQDFVRDDKFNAAMYSYNIKLKFYWNYITGGGFSPLQSISSYKDTDWVQCDNKDCLKWRRLPPGCDVTKLPEKWYCHMHPSGINCSLPEDVHDADEEIKLTPRKKSKLSSKRKSEEGPSELSSKRSKKNGSSSSNNEAALFTFPSKSSLTTSSSSKSLPALEAPSNCTTGQTETLRNSDNQTETLTNSDSQTETLTNSDSQTETLTNSDRQQSVLPIESRESQSLETVAEENNDSKTGINKFVLDLSYDQKQRNQLETFASSVKRECESSELKNQSGETNVLDLPNIKDESVDEISDMINKIVEEEMNIFEVRTRLDDERRKNEMAEIKMKLEDEKRKEIVEIKARLEEEKNKEIAEIKTRLNEEKRKEIAELKSMLEEKNRKEIVCIRTRLHKESKELADIKARLDKEKKMEIEKIKTRLGKEKRKEITEIKSSLEEEKMEEIAYISARLIEEKKKLVEIKTRLDEEKRKEIAEMKSSLDDVMSKRIAGMTRELHEKEMETATILTRLDYFCNKIRQLMRRLAPYIPIGDDADIEQLVDDMLAAEFGD